MSTITTEEPGDHLTFSKGAMLAGTVDDENSAHQYNEALAKMRNKYSKQRKCPIRQRSIFKKSSPKSKAARQKGAKFIEMIKTNLEAVPKKVISSEDITNMMEAMVERMTYYNRREESGELSAKEKSDRKTLGEIMRQVWLILAKRFGEIDAEADERIAKTNENDSSGNIQKEADECRAKIDEKDSSGNIQKEADECRAKIDEKDSSGNIQKEFDDILVKQEKYGQDINDRIRRNRETMAGRADDVASADLQPDPSTAPDTEHNDSTQQ